MRPGLETLLEAYDCAKDVRRNVWDFAVEIHTLRGAGLTRNDLRWLVCKGYVEHRVELRRPDEIERAFRDACELKFCKRSCVVLTSKGADFAHEYDIVSTGEAGPGHPPGQSQDGDGHPNGHVPEWNPVTRELHLGGILIKRFKQPSQNQERVLTAFQEEGWPQRIDDPLLQTGDLDPKERLRNTIKALNRNQKQHLLKIKGDGTGEGVMWEAHGDGKE